MMPPKGKSTKTLQRAGEKGFRKMNIFFFGGGGSGVGWGYDETGLFFWSYF